MSAQFQVDTAQIQSAAAELQSISGEIESSVTRMTTRLQALQDAWRGSAASGFQSVTTSWSATQRQVRASLDEIQAMLGRAGTQYADVEASNAALFRG